MQFPFSSVNADDPKDVATYLAQVNATLADMNAEVATAGLRPGMAGYDQDGTTIPSGTFEPRAPKK